MACPQLSPGERARAELLADPHRPGREIAELAGCGQQTVHRVRRQLETIGAIPARIRPRPPAWHAPGLAPMPLELTDLGLCTRHPQPGLWTSRLPSDRARAISVCSACPVRSICAAWSIGLPPSDTAIYGGMMASQRLAARRQRAQAAQAAL